MKIRERLNYWLHWRTPELGAAVLIIVGLFVWSATRDGGWLP